MTALLIIPILLFSVILHEYMHGYAAYRCGDDTAYLMGRLTFNPLAHVDLVGTIVVPLLCYSAGLPVFGWAKPVPVNYTRLYHPSRDMAKVAAAGPLSNLAFVVVCALVLKLALAAGAPAIAASLLLYAVAINLMLAIFNLIPVPPLDGSKILAAFLPPVAAARYMQLERYGMLIIIFLLFTNIWRMIVVPLFNFCFNLILMFAGAS